MNCATYDRPCSSPAVASLNGVALCSACLANYRSVGEMPVYFTDPSDGAPQDPQQPGESPGGGTGKANTIMDVLKPEHRVAYAALLSALDSPAAPTAAPNHCQYLETCDDNSCPACGLTMKDLGESSFSNLHDDPIAFLRQLDSRDAHDRESIIVAIAAWGGEAVDYVGSFIAETRNRAMILEMLS